MKVAPAGGPKDKVAAKIAEIEPASGTRSIMPDAVTFSFDDYIDRSVRNAFVIQPSTRFSTSYAGDEVELSFEEPLKPNTTYVITLGTEWKDLRGNTPAEAVTMVFSTGPDLDSGRVTGSITAQKKQNLTALLYVGADTLSASFDPRTRKPEYRMPIGTSGNFVIGGLRDGRYRLLVIRDDNKNFLLDANEDFVFAPEDLDVISGSSYPQQLLLGPSLTAQTDTVIPNNVKDTVIPNEVRNIPSDSTKLDSVRVDPGNIIGSFADSLDLKGPYLLRLRSTTDMVIRSISLAGDGAFTVDSVPPGSYAMDIVIDRNNNGLYDHGTPAPFQHGERWIPIQGTITVRSRWSTEDVKVVLR
jgi:uncharacterized protein (DUF2141 family)